MKKFRILLHNLQRHSTQQINRLTRKQEKLLERKLNIVVYSSEHFSFVRVLIKYTTYSVVIFRS